jgi:hypothetical protein
MAKRLAGTITRLGNARISRGDIKFDEIALRDERGGTPLWKSMSMARAVADRLAPGLPAVFYYSGLFGVLYGVRTAGEPAVFDTWGARWYAPWLSFFIFLCGVATSMFLFPILVALAGFAGILVSIDARVARARFRRDERNQLLRAAAQPR